MCEFKLTRILRVIVLEGELDRLRHSRMPMVVHVAGRFCRFEPRHLFDDGNRSARNVDACDLMPGGDFVRIRRQVLPHEGMHYDGTFVLRPEYDLLYLLDASYHRE